MDDIMKQNPELMKQFAKAAVGSMNTQPSQSQMRTDIPQTSQNQRSEMNGPSNLDDIINEINIGQKYS